MRFFSRLFIGCLVANGVNANTAPTPTSVPAAPSVVTAMSATGIGCVELAQRLPNVSAKACEAAQLQASDTLSVRKRAILLRDVQADNPQLRILVIGGIHGDELSSASVALHWIGLAESSHSANPQLPVHWRFVPALNPDGLLRQPPQRVNAHGVDLNRNFPTPNWVQETKVYWEKRTRKDPRRWPGPKPLSEPETQFVAAQMASFKPNLIVSIHAPYGLLDFDGPSVPPRRLGRLFLDQVGIFPGSLGNYGGVHKGVPVVTVELPNATRTPLDAETRQMWKDLNKWVAEHLGPAHETGPELPAALKADGH